MLMLLLLLLMLTFPLLSLLLLMLPTLLRPSVSFLLHPSLSLTSELGAKVPVALLSHLDPTRLPVYAVF